ncbi:MAG TPA: prolyl oligopeptidase family serine peptidase [Planctomycetota bacterium]|nr:prolyl oligopeptidase family serine peptidase [Planctomycetota bacterium]
MSISMRPGFGSAALVLALVTAVASAQRPLTHDDYDQWKSLRGTAHSQDGKWVAYAVEPQWGDGVLEVRATEGDTVYRHPLGNGPHFSSDGRFVVFTIAKSKVEERNKKIEELRKKQSEKGKEGGQEAEPKEAATEPAAAPAAGAGGQRRAGGRGPGGPGGGRPGAGAADAEESSRERGDLGIMDLATGKVEVVKHVKGFTLPEPAAILVYHFDKPEPERKDGEQQDGEAKAEARTGEAAAAKVEGAEGKEQPTPPAPKQEPQPSEPVKTEPAKTEPTGEAATKGEPAVAGPKPEAGARGRGRRGPGGAGGRGDGKPVDPLEKKRAEGTVLVVRELATGNERRFDDVVSYGLTHKATWLWFHTSAKKPDAGKKYGLFASKLAGGEPFALQEGIADFSGFTTDKQETGLAFTSNLADFAAEKPRLDLYLWDCKEQPARRIVAPGTPGLPAGKVVASGGLAFARDGSVVAFALAEAPEPDPLPILPEDKVVLDLWHWNDGQLQTAQQKQGGRRNQNWSAVWHRDQQRLQVLGDAQVPQARLLTADGSLALAEDGKPYEKLTTWDGRYQDVYLVNTIDGSRKKVLEKQRGNVSSSIEGHYLLWFGLDYHWWSIDTATLEKRDLTGALGVAFHREEDDHPEPDPAHGVAGWTAGDAEVVLYDEFDLWRVSPRSGTATCVTDGFGRANRLRLRHQVLDRELEHLPQQLLLTATNIDTLAEGFYLDALEQQQRPLRLVMLDKNLGGLSKAKQAERYFFTLSTFAEFPDLWTAHADFSGMHRLSAANPQQAQYRWGRSELISWINGDGKRLKGILIKPDGFDPQKKYPMLVSFYERMSQGLHNYVAPAPGTSPNASYYVSNGYLWFMPDVVYEVGYPGESCVKCVVAGVESLIAQGFVDEQHIGAAGHSWGGYQTAFLVTRTHIFAAVESGAPVSNMISAYGGIRYETGVSRQFQYEQSQSRIGGTPWQYPLRYWENSPIFFADKVKTPVLILHNDSDGAVPWTNGIEYFTALRRLGRECYLFNYSGEGHGLGKRQNQKDWARRMAEYFAHHLQGAPAPKWMQEGVPYAERDKEKLPFTPSFVELTARLKQGAPVEASTGAPANPPASEPASKPEKPEESGGHLDVRGQAKEKPATPPERQPAPAGRGGEQQKGG